MRRFPSEEVLDGFLDFWHPGHSSNKNDFAQLTLCEISVPEAVFAWSDGLLNMFVYKLFEACSGQVLGKMLWTGLIRSNKWKVNFSLKMNKAMEIEPLVFSNFFCGSSNNCLSLKLSTELA